MASGMATDGTHGAARPGSVAIEVRSDVCTSRSN